MKTIKEYLQSGHMPKQYKKSFDDFLELITTFIDKHTNAILAKRKILDKGFNDYKNWDIKIGEEDYRLIRIYNCSSAAWYGEQDDVFNNELNAICQKYDFKFVPSLSGDYISIVTQDEEDTAIVFAMVNSTLTIYLYKYEESGDKRIYN